MGCDIHTRAEVLVQPRKWVKSVEATEDTEAVGAHWADDGPEIWKAVKKPIFDYVYFEDDDVIDPFTKYGKMPYAIEPYTGRNYWLFSVLANVRNTRHTANLFDSSMRYEERDSLQPIAHPRGLPEDASKGWRKYVERYGSDLHSLSYFTLTELLEAIEGGAFEQTFQCRGYISPRQLHLLENSGVKPDSWSTFSSNGISRAEWDAKPETERANLVATETDSLFSRVSVAAEWTATTEGAFAFFLDHTIPGLMRLAPWDGPFPREALWAAKKAGVDTDVDRSWDTRKRLTDRVRLVFGFDN